MKMGISTLEIKKKSLTMRLFKQIRESMVVVFFFFLCLSQEFQALSFCIVSIEGVDVHHRIVQERRSCITAPLPVGIDRFLSQSIPI